MRGSLDTARIDTEAFGYVSPRKAYAKTGASQLCDGCYDLSVEHDRWMFFVDGENLTIQAQKHFGSRLRPGRYHQADVFVWFPDHRPRASMFGSNLAPDLFGEAVRAYYYTSLTGSEDDLASVRRALRTIGFEPRVFKRDVKGRPSKGVDIGLATDFLSNAFLGNYDAAVLLAGDGDYVPMVEEVKRLGKRVYVTFFESSTGLNSKLRLVADDFFPLERWFEHHWKPSE
jgi:uncharacterized LabA/DUF88 family protein